MPSFDFFTAGALPAPVLDEKAAAAIAAEHFGLRVRARSLGSQQDANFLLTAADGDDGVVGVLKVSNGAFGPADIAAQSAAADLLARRVEGLRVATTVPPPTGAASRTVTLPSGTDAVARVLRYLPGGTLSGSGHVPPRTVAALGRLAGRVAAALADFADPALDRVLQWDLRHAERWSPCSPRPSPTPTCVSACSTRRGASGPACRPWPRSCPVRPSTAT
jgi:Ser/Thr protein kinase RdoA (MazF antagonist)